MTNAISNMDDVIDSRDIIDRIAELEDTRDNLQTEYEEAAQALEEFENDPSTFAQDGSTPDELREAVANAEKAKLEWAESEEGQELKVLLALQDEAEGYSPDWTYGAQLIRESYFEQAMDEFLEDIGYLPKNLPSYLTITVDYDALKQDYTEVDFDGVTYYVR